MIKFTLKCQDGHEFEAWFGKGSDFEDQSARGLVQCPNCGDDKIEKAPMAPNIQTSRSKSSIRQYREMEEKVRHHIAENCDNVGDDFSNEARAIHYGEKPERGIYGHASPAEAKELLDEGVGIVPLPASLDPAKKKKLN
jgi:hypothetical protein